MNKKIIIGIAAIVVIVAFLIFSFTNWEGETGEISSGEESEEVRKLLIVTEPFPPFAYEEDGVVKGIHVDIADLVMSRLDISYEIELMPWSRALKMIETGKAESLLIASYTDERNEFAYYTEDQRLAKNKVLPRAYLDKIDMVFFIRNVYEDVMVFESFDQIKESEYRVGLDAGYAYADDVLEAGWNTVYYYTMADNFEALAEGKIDMYLQDRVAGIEAIKELGLEDEITYIDKPVMFFIYQWPFSKNSDYPNLKEVWEKTIDELAKIPGSEEYNEIYMKYGVEP